MVRCCDECNVSNSRDPKARTEVEAFLSEAPSTNVDPWERTFTDRLRELLADDARGLAPSSAEVAPSDAPAAESAASEPGLSGLGDEWFDDPPAATEPDLARPLVDASQHAVGPWDDLVADLPAQSALPRHESAVPHSASASGIRERPTADVPVVMGSTAAEIAQIAVQMLEHIEVADRCVLAVDGGALVVDAAPGTVQSGRWRAREPGGKTWTAPSLEALVSRALGVDSAESGASERVRNR